MVAAGLYDPRFEHDACGVGFVADLSGRGGHEVVARALRVLCNLEHRGAKGGDPGTGDGAGILTQIPDEFFRATCDFELPEAGAYAAGMAFFSAERHLVTPALARLAAAEGLTILGWREVPFDITACGDGARAVLPDVLQMFVAGALGQRGMELERMAFCLRKRAEHEAGVYFASLSARTIVYKGMLSAPQLGPFYPDLSDPRYGSALALVHSRFSTNTFPSWPLAHPYRYVAHNGEINTVRGNRNWMRAREAMLASELIPDSADGRGIERLFPILDEDASDSASFDECLELLHMGGRSLPHAVLMMIPEPWENHEEMTPERRAFYRYHAALMEPWDGPALIAFTDGSVIGAVLDRNGLRPGRYWVTSDGLVVLASEVGVLDIDPATVIRKGRLQPGRVFLADTAAGRLVEDEEVKAALAAEHPYENWLHAGLLYLDDLPDRPRPEGAERAGLLAQQRVHGYTEEELRVILAPMARAGAEPIGSMGTDTPVAVLSGRPRLMFDYFTQLFAQVTNPPLDAIREELVTSLGTITGPEQNLLHPIPASCRQIVLPYPVINDNDLAKIVHINDEGNLPGFASHVVDGRYDPAGGGEGLRARLADICAEVSAAIEAGARLIILSDRPRGGGQQLVPIPVAAADRRGAPPPDQAEVAYPGRTRSGGRGRARVSPRGPARRLRCRRGQPVPGHRVGQGPGPARGHSERLGVQGRGQPAQGPRQGPAEDHVQDGRVHRRLLHRSADLRGYRPGPGGSRGLLRRHHVAAVRRGLRPARRGDQPADRPRHGRGRGDGLPAAGHRRRVPVAARGRASSVQPRGGLQAAARHPQPPVRDLQGVHQPGRRPVAAADDAARAAPHPRRGRRCARAGTRAVTGPVRVEDVESVASIVRRFATGAMSYGSISAEAHQTLAIAMNRLGARSNTGEGGEDPDRFIPDANGDLRRSAVKQVASGRFGVTSEYLVNADDLQIKMAQGAKPGEGGQLPGHKVYPWIAKTRYSTPGVGLISPPPHHDIYSIEDLAQLIHDLKNANPAARVHVKLVSEVGVGTVAAGVSKAHADVVLISGHDGGTGAAPLTSLKHAGAPWELGLAETQQTLLRNKLRDRIVVQADGQLKTGRDVIIAALLGAEEFGFASAPLVVSGCIMMRVCHLDTCPVGVATQNPELRARFSGKPEFVVNFFEFIAEEVREYLARLGFRTLEEIIGRADLLDTVMAVEHWKASGLDLSPILYTPPLPEGAALSCVTSQDHGLDRALDNTLIQLAEGALTEGRPVRLDLPIRNVNRTVGTMLGYEVTRRWGGEGLPEDTIDISFRGSAGQSFGAFLPRGVTLRLDGDANDYLGKGLSGGRLIVRPPREATFTAEEQVIAGNVIGYGATAGEIFLRGIVGERFCVRNSGALAVAEGTGDHGCEYMTGGRVVILGPVGRNFAAGMSGGIAYVLDLPEIRVNMEMVDLDQVEEDDAKFVREVVERHHAETGSAVAARLLADWDPGRFTKVMPKDYKRVLSAASQAEREGRDVNEAVMAAAHG